MAHTLNTAKGPTDPQRLKSYKILDGSLAPTLKCGEYVIVDTHAKPEVGKPALLIDRTGKPTAVAKYSESLSSSNIAGAIIMVGRKI